jgi:hypothetical protein
MNSMVDVLSTFHPDARRAALAVFGRKTGEFDSQFDVALMAARARWRIELDQNVPLRWLAALAGISVKTTRNLASTGQVSTITDEDGQVVQPREAARWLSTRGIAVSVGTRKVPSRKQSRAPRTVPANRALHSDRG